MARDETARDSEPFLLDRRSHRRLAGAAAATVVGPTPATRPSGNHRRCDVDRESSREGRDGHE